MINPKLKIKRPLQSCLGKTCTYNSHYTQITAMLLAYEENTYCEVHLISLDGILATELWLKAMMLKCHL